jgi:hypothetical protein
MADAVGAIASRRGALSAYRAAAATAVGRA